MPRVGYGSSLQIEIIKSYVNLSWLTTDVKKLQVKSNLLVRLNFYRFR